MVTVLAAHGLLLAAFCVGLGRAAGSDRVRRWVAILLLASVVATVPLHPFFPMSSRGGGTGPNDTVHIALTVVFSLLVAAAMACAAVG